MPIARSGGSAGGTPVDWFNDLPFVTKWLLVSSLGLSLCVFLGVISGGAMFFYGPWIIQKFQIWRLVTPFLFGGGFSFPYAITLYMLISHSRLYEVSPYNTGGGGTSADYLVMMLFGMVCMNLAMFFFNGAIMFKGLMMYVVYVWSRKAEGAQSGFFMFKFPAIYLPWALFAYDLITGHSVFDDLVGIIVGHIYYFLVVEFPIHYQRRLITTPRFVVEQLAWVAGVAPPPIHPSHRTHNTPPAQPFPPTRNWGTGRVLGGGSTATH